MAKGPSLASHRGRSSPAAAAASGSGSLIRSAEPDSESRPASSAPARLSFLLRRRQQFAYCQLQLAQRRASAGYGAPATSPPAAGTDLGKRGCAPRSARGRLPRSRRLMANRASGRCRSLSPLRPLARARSVSPMTPATSASLGRSACEGVELGMWCATNGAKRDAARKCRRGDGVRWETTGAGSEVWCAVAGTGPRRSAQPPSRGRDAMHDSRVKHGG